MPYSRVWVSSFVGFAAACVTVAATATPGELTALDAEAQINIRAEASTKADVVGTGTVGDRVEILKHTNGKDGLIWYQIAVTNTQTKGWVRGDLVTVYGTGGGTPAAENGVPSKPTKAKSVSKPVAKAGVPLPPPKIRPAPAVSDAPQSQESPKPKADENPAASPKSAERKAAESPKPKQAQSNKAKGTQAIAATLSAPESTLIGFQTATYAVRVFSKAGQLRMNLFNKQTSTLALNGVAVQSQGTDEGTRYTYETDINIEVFVPASGPITLTTSALGQTWEEVAE